MYHQVEGDAFHLGDGCSVELCRGIDGVGLAGIAAQQFDDGQGVGSVGCRRCCGLVELLLGGKAQIELIALSIHADGLPHMQNVVDGIVDRRHLETVGEAEAVLVEAEHVDKLVVEIGVEFAACACETAVEHVAPHGLHDVLEANIGKVVFDDEPQVLVDGEGHDGIQIGQHLMHERIVVVAAKGAVIEFAETCLVKFLNGHEQGRGLNTKLSIRQVHKATILKTNIARHTKGLPDRNSAPKRSAGKKYEITVFPTPNINDLSIMALTSVSLLLFISSYVIGSRYSSSILYLVLTDKAPKTIIKIKAILLSMSRSKISISSLMTRNTGLFLYEIFFCLI